MAALAVSIVAGPLLSGPRPAASLPVGEARSGDVGVVASSAVVAGAVGWVRADAAVSLGEPVFWPGLEAGVLDQFGPDLE